MGYTQITDDSYDNMNDRPLFLCSKDGIVVADQETHDDFHARIDNLIYP